PALHIALCLVARLGARRLLRLDGHPRAPRLREADRNGLFRGPRSVLAFADVMDLFAYELARLRRWRLPCVLGRTRPLDRLLLGHSVPHAKTVPHGPMRRLCTGPAKANDRHSNSNSAAAFMIGARPSARGALLAGFGRGSRHGL